MACMFGWNTYSYSLNDLTITHFSIHASYCSITFSLVTFVKSIFGCQTEESISLRSGRCLGEDSAGKANLYHAWSESTYLLPFILFIIDLGCTIYAITSPSSASDRNNVYLVPVSTLLAFLCQWVAKYVLPLSVGSICQNSVYRASPPHSFQ